MVGNRALMLDRKFEIYELRERGGGGGGKNRPLLAFLLALKFWPGLSVIYSMSNKPTTTMLEMS